MPKLYPVWINTLAVIAGLFCWW